MKPHKFSIYISLFTIFANFSNASLDNKNVQLTSHACYDNCKSQLDHTTHETILIPDEIQPISDNKISYKRINFLKTGEYLFLTAALINAVNFIMTAALINAVNFIMTTTNKNDENIDNLEKYYLIRIYFLSNVYQTMINIIFASNYEHFNSFKNNLNYNILYSTFGLISLFASINKTMLNLQYSFLEAKIYAAYNMFAIAMYILYNHKN